MKVKVTNLNDEFEMKPAAKKDNSSGNAEKSFVIDKPCIRAMGADASADIAWELDWESGCITMHSKNKDRKRWVVKQIESGGPPCQREW